MDLRTSQSSSEKLQKASFLFTLSFLSAFYVSSKHFFAMDIKEEEKEKEDELGKELLSLFSVCLCVC